MFHWTIQIERRTMYTCSAMIWRHSGAGRRKLFRNWTISLRRTWQCRERRMQPAIRPGWAGSATPARRSLARLPVWSRVAAAAAPAPPSAVPAGDRGSGGPRRGEKGTWLRRDRTQWFSTDVCSRETGTAVRRRRSLIQGGADIGQFLTTMQSNPTQPDPRLQWPNPVPIPRCLRKIITQPITNR